MALLPVKRRDGARGSLTRLHDEMDDLFRGFFSDWDWPAWSGNRWPAVDITEKDNEFIVKAEVPGCKADDIDISVHGNTLSISGEKKHEEEKKEKGYYHKERTYGSFRRDFTLSAELNSDKIEARCKDGILTITLPKSEKTRAVKVKVKNQ